jgi:MFS superfamily sulfate permease-like transporter
MTSNNQNLQKNFLSGLLVSFIALPLCIAISLASGFPVLSGIFTAIIGGIVVSQFSGSNVTINGPAAGMIVVILDAVERLGEGDLILGYKYTLAAIICASIAQIATSYTKLPDMMRKFPESVIRGMMMAIGLIVILKQSFVLFSYAAPKIGLIPLFGQLPKAFFGMQLETFFIGIFVIIFIVLWKKFIEGKSKIKWLRTIPTYLIAIILGSAIAAIIGIDQTRHYLHAGLSSPIKSHFVALPDSILSALSLPNFDKIFSYQFALEVFSIFAVGSLETVLSAIAVDKIDPWQRVTNLKRDLRAVGIGNFLCGMIGALPMIAEIVRSTANVKYGATNKWSNFAHGVCLLLMITVFGAALKFIPLCVLAAMLIMIGWNLLNVKLFYEMFRNKKSDFFTILCVIFFTLYIDLLFGIACGGLLYLVLLKIGSGKKVQ